MGQKPRNAIKGKKGFQRTGRTDPQGTPQGFFARVWQKILNIFGVKTNQQSLMAQSTPAAGAPPNWHNTHLAWAARQPEAPKPAWPEAKQLMDRERDALWKEAFYRADNASGTNRFDYPEREHDHIANMSQLIKDEMATERTVGRPGVDDFAYVTRGDVPLQISALKRMAQGVLDKADSKKSGSSRWEGLGVYGSQTIELAKEIDGKNKDSELTHFVEYQQPDGSVKRIEVLKPTVSRLISLVDEDQRKSTKLQESHQKRESSDSWKNSANSRFAL